MHRFSFTVLFEIHFAFSVFHDFFGAVLWFLIFSNAPLFFRYFSITFKLTKANFQNAKSRSVSLKSKSTAHAVFVEFMVF